MKAGDLIKTLAGKTGTEIPEEVLTQLSAIDIDDTLAENLSSNLITSTEAKNNPQIKGHYYAQLMDGFDKQQEDVFKKLGLTDEQIVELKTAEPKSGKRALLYADKIIELQKDIVKNSGKGNDEKAKQLEVELKEAKQALQASIDQSTNLVAQHYDKEIDWKLGSELSSLKLKEAIPAEYRGSLALSAIKDYLKTNDAKIVLENGVPKLKRASDPSLDVTDFDLKTAINKSLAEKQLLETAVVVDKKDPIIIHSQQKKVNTVALDNINKAREMMQEKI